jgi:hypothetical protein
MDDGESWILEAGDEECKGKKKKEEEEEEEKKEEKQEEPRKGGTLAEPKICILMKTL